VRILLIDDSTGFRDEFEHYLKMSGVSVIRLDHARNVDDGARRLAEDLHDLYFIDYRLGSDSGLRLVADARAAGMTKPIIILTGYDGREVDAEAERSGASEYLNKDDLSPRKLGHAVRYAISNTKRALEGGKAEAVPREQPILDNPAPRRRRKPAAGRN
jgi:DNA-binding NtrC family response regulator